MSLRKKKNPVGRPRKKKTVSKTKKVVAKKETKKPVKGKNLKVKNVKVKSAPSNIDEIKDVFKKPSPTPPPITHTPVSTSCVSSNWVLNSRENHEYVAPINESSVPIESMHQQQINVMQQQIDSLNYEVNKLKKDNLENLGLPICVSVLNASRHTLKDVELFNDNHKSQNSIVYQCESGLLTYDELLKFKNVSKDNIGMIRLNLEGKNDLVMLSVTHKIQTGVQYTSPIPMTIDPYQIQSMVLQRRMEIPHNSGSNIIINALAPMTRMTFILFLISPATKTQRKKRK